MACRDAATASDEIPCERVFHDARRDASSVFATGRLVMRKSHTCRTAFALLLEANVWPPGRYASAVTAATDFFFACARGMCTAAAGVRASHTYTSPSRAPLVT